ncbi:hypothetical protein KDL01_40495 [Actinospica durhamensis]|uniref:Uncharacterized protein n=1 Tax=Actinospica durhamensis TaxID=1508375 RepID=A0A941EZN3_9ACTN|nr:hypothetical protein [Actinospica durhamensis]MBR7839602.1 hypothetical protein [Actinospica durhamensis]
MSSNGSSAAYAPRRARRGGAQQERTVVAARPERGHEMHLIPARGPKLEKHILEPDEFNAVALPVGDDGVVIGTDQASRPAVISLFKPRAMDAALIGGAYMAQLIALRATATGARVVVETARPQLWAPLAQNAGGGQQVIAVVPVRRVGNLGATAASPVLLLRDCGARPPRSAAPKTSWMTTLTLLPFLDPSFAGHLISSDYVALQQISPQEAELAARLFRLSPQDVAALPTLMPELALWAAKHGRQYVYTAPTHDESALLGAPRRMD